MHENKDAQDTDASSAETGEAAGEEASEEASDGLIEVWRPGGRRHSAPARQGRRAPAHERGKDGKGGKGSKRDKGGAGSPGPGGKPRGHSASGDRKKAGAGKGAKPRRERPVDPDSPFAKLAALKQDLEKKS